jgi:hypothetical protein
LILLNDLFGRPMDKEVNIELTTDCDVAKDASAIILVR